jgi:hypothetical protein
MGIYFNPELTRNAEVPGVEAVQLLQRQLLAATQLQVDDSLQESVGNMLVLPHTRTTQFSPRLQR